MGRFPWSQGHSKQASDKAHGMAPDWLSKDHVEPSRQALTDLIKEYSSFESGHSDISPKARSRSRTNTVTSSFSVYARSVSDASNDLTSRPSSQQSFVDGGMPLAERHESTAKSLLAKGSRILKRQGSKLNLLPSQTEERSSEFPGARAGDAAPVTGLQRQPTLISRRTGLKRSISGPFAFQHLTHGEQTRFQSLNSVSTTDLSSEFEAVQSAQQPDDQIRGIPVADLPVKKDDPSIAIALEEPTSPTTEAIPYLPITPPRPSPPPKDGLMSPYTPSDFRLSRSMENFSRPTRLSVTAIDISPTTAITTRISAMSPNSQVNAMAKPLPHLPGGQVGHAVSTRDDIALPLRTAPLPSPPKPIMEVVEEESGEEKEIPPRVSSRVPSSVLQSLPFPTVKQHKRRSQSSGEIQFDIASFSRPLRLSNADLTKSPGGEVSLMPKCRISIGTKPISIDDWEDAIDYSWEHAAEIEADDDAYNAPTIPRQPSHLSIPHDNYLVVEQSHGDETSSASSTPLMMQLPAKAHLEMPTSLPGRGEEPPSPLLGLGLGPLQPHISVSFTSGEVSPIESVSGTTFSAGDVYQSRAMRSPGSMMSKSSSQESIIASIFGTQRSSNSSTSLSDFAHLATGSFEGSMEHLKLDFPEFASTPSMDKHFREGSQDTIRDDFHFKKSSEAVGDVDVVAPLTRFTPSPTIKHDRGASAPQIPNIPERKSSMADAVEASKAQLGRKRANTGTSRPRRNTRVSYSLFPTTMTG